MKSTFLPISKVALILTCGKHSIRVELKYLRLFKRTYKEVEMYEADEIDALCLLCEKCDEDKLMLGLN
jgi:hypothetical protein